MAYQAHLVWHIFVLWFQEVRYEQCIQFTWLKRLNMHAILLSIQANARTLFSSTDKVIWKKKIRRMDHATSRVRNVMRKREKYNRMKKTQNETFIQVASFHLQANLTFVWIFHAHPELSSLINGSCFFNLNDELHADAIFSV